MELAAADIHPHVVEPRHQIRVARQPQPHDVDGDGLALVRHADIDMAKLNDVAEVLLGAVEDRHRRSGIIHGTVPQVAMFKAGPHSSPGYLTGPSCRPVLESGLKPGP